MTATAWPARQMSTYAGVAWTLGLLLGIIGWVVATWLIVGVAPCLIAAFAGIVLYPGLAGIIAARSRSSDAVAAVATLLPTLLFTTFVLFAISSPWGWPSKRVIALAVGVCLFFAAWLFGTVVAAADMARPGGKLRVASAMAIGFSGAVFLLVPLLLVVLLPSNHT